MGRDALLAGERVASVVASREGSARTSMATRRPPDTVKAMLDIAVPDAVMGGGLATTGGRGLVTHRGEVVDDSLVTSRRASWLRLLTSSLS